MELIIGKDHDIKFILAENEWPGVKRIAGKVAQDIKTVTGASAEIICVSESDAAGISFEAGCVYVGTLAHSALADRISDLVPDTEKIRGKRESYVFKTVKAENTTALVIAGSDKRGSIYGLFRISEILGVSPWVWFADVAPAHRYSVGISSEHDLISHEPSVEYRGIFINDEWPSFGNWTFDHFGGFTTEMYEHVFELILRLKGNYLWPAMWTSNFSLDGPGLSNAELADEMGIVMSNSHHEPCLRHSEEWDLVKGPDTEYGTEWNFDKNREGLTNYWRDGLKRNGRFENIVTMGMRGERDSEIMGAEATLKDNIDYIKEVVEVQNKLIRETIDEDVSKVPRMIAIYKEVEKYYYGDESAPGLKTWDGLDGITCMLCEDNHGNMRGLPDEKERDRDGGFGMYYHFDYHGGPVSFEWINSTTLKKTWEQMCEAYEAGVRKIWIVNTGDLKPQELPISFFMDLAYDYDKWGISDKDSAGRYLDEWSSRQFKEHAAVVADILDSYTYINMCRRPEALNPDVYHPVNYGEADYMLAQSAALYNKATEIGKEYKDTPLEAAYEELAGFPARAAANLLYMQLCAGRNKYLAASGRPSANVYADIVDKCMTNDAALTDLYHSLADGKWNHMMRSEHIGFTNWNDEEAMYPVRNYVTVCRRPRMVVSLTEADKWSAGGDWTRKPLYVTDFFDPAATEAYITIENAGSGSFEWTADTDASWIRLSAQKGTLPEYVPVPEAGPGSISGRFKENPEEYIPSVCRISISIDREAIPSAAGETVEGKITVSSGFTHVDVIVPAVKYDRSVSGDKKHFIPVIPKSYLADKPEWAAPELWRNSLGLVMDSDDHNDIKDTSAGHYETLTPMGKYISSLKAYPVTAHFKNGGSAPAVSYDIIVPESGDYDVTFVTAPSNPIDGSGQLKIAVSLDTGKAKTLSMVENGFMGGENSCPEWCISVLDQEHVKTMTMSLTEGAHTITVHAVDPGVVLNQIRIRPADTKWAYGYIKNTRR